MAEEYLIWRIETKALSRSIVEPPHHLSDFIIRDGGKIALLKKVLADEAIGVFVCSPLPG